MPGSFRTLSKQRFLFAMLAIGIWFRLGPARLDCQNFSSMAGTIADTSGSFVPDAGVKVINHDTGFSTFSQRTALVTMWPQLFLRELTLSA
jgi:hypothetical protein